MSNHDQHYDDEFEGRPELVKLRARTLFLRNIGIGLLAVFMIASMTLLVITSLQGTIVRNQLLDCTTPGNPCYDDGQKRTAEAIAQLINAGHLDEVETRRIIILALACDARPGIDTPDEIQRCVDEEQEGTR